MSQNPNEFDPNYNPHADPNLRAETLEIRSKMLAEEQLRRETEQMTNALKSAERAESFGEATGALFEGLTAFRGGQFKRK